MNGWKRKLLNLMSLLLILSWSAPAEELQLNSDQLKTYIEGKIAEKIEEAFMTSANMAEGAVRDASYFNEILREYESYGLQKTNFAQTAVELYRGYLAAHKKDAEESDPAKRINARNFYQESVKAVLSRVISPLIDQESQQIAGDLKGLWGDAKSRLDKILSAKKALDEAPEAEAVNVLKNLGLSGNIIDDMEFLEVNYRGLKNMAADYLEAWDALVAVTGAIRTRSPGDKIEALFTMGAKYGGRVPVLGMFVQKYFEVAQAMIEACKGLGKILRKREQYCVGGANTGYVEDTIGSDPRNVQWVKQFPNREACPESQVGLFRDVYVETQNTLNIFFWVGGRFIEGRDHGGIEDLRALIQWLRRNGHQAKAVDIKYLAGAYNIPPGFKNRADQIRGKAQELQREVHRLTDQLLCRSEATDLFLLEQMGLKPLLDELKMDHGLVRSFPFVEEIVDRVIEDRLIKGTAEFYNNLLRAIDKCKRTMAFRVHGTISDPMGRRLSGVGIEASPSRKTVPDCSMKETDAKGYFRITYVKSLDESLDVLIKAVDSQDRRQEKIIAVSGTADEYVCDLVMGEEERIVSLIISPQEKKLKKGENISFSVIGVRQSGESERIPSAQISWSGAPQGAFHASASGRYPVTAAFSGLSAVAMIEVAEEEKKEDEAGKEEDVDIDKALEELNKDNEEDPCQNDVASMLQRFNTLNQRAEQVFSRFTAASAKFYQEINSRRADPCSNRMVAFTYYQAKSISQELDGIGSEMSRLYSDIVITSALCSLAESKATIKQLLYAFNDLGPKIGVAERSLAAMQGRLGELACDEQEMERNGQLVTAQGDIDPNLLQQGGGMVEIQGDSVDNTGEGLQDERNYTTALLIMVWDSGTAKDDIFSVSLSGYGYLGSTPKGGRQVFAPERVQPGRSYTVSITTLVTDVGAGTWSIMVSYKGRILVPATAGYDNGSVSFVLPSD